MYLYHRTSFLWLFEVFIALDTLCPSPNPCYQLYWMTRQGWRNSHIRVVYVIIFLLIWLLIIMNLLPNGVRDHLSSYFFVYFLSWLLIARSRAIAYLSQLSRVCYNWYLNNLFVSNIRRTSLRPCQLVRCRATKSSYFVMSGAILSILKQCVIASPPLLLLLMHVFTAIIHFPNATT